MSYLQVVPPRTPGSSLRAALYGRASVDRFQRGRSIKDQFAVCQAECLERGWAIVGYYEDRDRSASSKAKKDRESYERMVEDIEAGKIDVIVYAERTRANRTLDGYVKLRQLCLRTGVLWCYDGRVYDLTKAADRRETARDAAEAEGEADSITDRNLRTVRLNAVQGKIHSKPPFGYKRHYDPDTGVLLEQTAHPEHAPVAVKLFEGVDQGRSLNSLLPLVRPYRPKTRSAGLRAMLRNKSYIGIRVHLGVEHPAVWPGIIDEALFYRVQAVLDSPERRHQRGTGLRHELSGIPGCTVCRADGCFDGMLPKGRFGQYRCGPQHVSVSEAALDAFVEEAVLTWLQSPAARAAFRVDSSEDELAMERVRLTALVGQLAEARVSASHFDPVTGMPQLSVASLAALEQSLTPKIQEAESRVKALLSVGDPLIDRLLSASAEDLDAMWSDELDLFQRRSVLRAVVRIEVGRAVRMGPRQDLAERVTLIFAGEPGFAEWPTAVVAGRGLAV